MNVVKVDGVYKTSRIAGPKHNYLGLIVERSSPVNIRIVQRSVKGDESKQIDESRLLLAVSEGVSEGNRESGQNLFVECIEYVSSDTPDYKAYTELAKAIVRFAAVE